MEKDGTGNYAHQANANNFHQQLAGLELDDNVNVRLNGNSTANEEFLLCTHL
jgi:hypothetical protein